MQVSDLTSWVTLKTTGTSLTWSLDHHSTTAMEWQCGSPTQPTLRLTITSSILPESSCFTLNTLTITQSQITCWSAQGLDQNYFQSYRQQSWSMTFHVMNNTLRLTMILTMWQLQTTWLKVHKLDKDLCSRSLHVKSLTLITLVEILQVHALSVSCLNICEASNALVPANLLDTPMKSVSWPIPPPHQLKWFIKMSSSPTTKEV